MNTLPRSAVALALCAAALAAQGPVAPTPQATARPTPGLQPPNVPLRQVWSLSMQRLPGDPAGTWTVCMSGPGVPASAGGRGSDDLVTGHYDAVADTFTPDGLAAGLNTSTGAEFGMRMLHDGLVATYSQWTPGGSSTWVATRPSVTAPWQPLGRIPNLGSMPEYDPAPVLVGGQLHLIFLRYLPSSALEVETRIAPFDLSTLRVGASRLLRRTAVSGGSAHSVDPIVDAQGDMIGLSYIDGVIPSSGAATGRHAFSFDLDPATPPASTFDDPGRWLMSGGRAGGRVFAISAAASINGSRNPYVVDVPMTWWVSSSAPVGGTLEIQVHRPPCDPARCSGISALSVAPAFRSSGLSIPGLVGELGLDLTVSVPVVVGQHEARSGLATTTLSVPASSSLAGLALPAQSVTIDLMDGSVVLGNTGLLRVR